MPAARIFLQLIADFAAYLGLLNGRSTAKSSEIAPSQRKWPENVFGWFVRLEYEQNGNLNVKVQDEDLVPGDAANPPPQPTVKASPLSKPRVIKKVTLAARAWKGMAEAEDCGVVSMEEV